MGRSGRRFTSTQIIAMVEGGTIKRIQSFMAGLREHMAFTKQDAIKLIQELPDDANLEDRADAGRGRALSGGSNALRPQEWSVLRDRPPTAMTEGRRYGACQGEDCGGAEALERRWPCAARSQICVRRAPGILALSTLLRPEAGQPVAKCIGSRIASRKS